MDKGAWWDLQSMESQRVRYDLAAEHAYTHTRTHTHVHMFKYVCIIWLFTYT